MVVSVICTWHICTYMFFVRAEKGVISQWSGRGMITRDGEGCGEEREAYHPRRQRVVTCIQDPGLVEEDEQRHNMERGGQ